MALAPGTRLGVYEVVSLLGAGGMGEVYKARDTRLNRTVAIKVLLDTLASGADLRARFEHEARTIARLDHPNICAVYDIGEHAGTAFLVMQYLEGQTLADRLRQGPLPVDQALSCAIEIARALDEAHRHYGITHRDLKPANVMLTRSGTKLLDFGLATARGPAAPLSMTAMTQLGATFSTAAGTILGTLHYMSPEQVEGREADARSDIFAFGATMYEMVTGRRAFDGDVPAAVIGAILRDDPPPVSTLRRSTPPALDHVVSTCLVKEPNERWQSAGDIRRQLTRILVGWRESGPLEVNAKDARTRRRAARLLAAVLGVALVAETAFAVRQWMRPPPESPVLRFAVTAPGNATFANANAVVTATQLAVSPDGHHLVFVATPMGGRPALWIRSLDALQSRLLPGTEDAEYPFWSPDSRFVGFFAAGKLKKSDLLGGLPLPLCDASFVPRGGTWNRDGIIVFAPDATSGLLQVPAEGGSTRQAMPLLPGETSHRWPSFLPDGQHFVVSVRGKQRGVYVGSLGTSMRTRVLDTELNAVYASGHLLTVREGFLLAYPFDEKRLQVTGSPARLAETVGGSSTLLAAVSVSNSGVLAYSEGLASPPGQLTWFDRHGASLGPATEAGQYVDFRLSPDGKRLALTRIDPTTSNSDIWLMDIGRPVPTRFTSDLSADVSPIWSPDGRRIVFRSDRNGLSQLFEKPSAGRNGAERLFALVEAWFPTDWSPDGKFIVYHAPVATNRFDVMLLPQSGDGKPIALGRSAFNESGARVSPDGRWIAYVSDESSRAEVYVRSFPRGDDEVRVSSGGGSEPRWCQACSELFYLASGGALMGVTFGTKTTLQKAAPQRLFQTHTPILGSPYRSNYEVTGDGQRFLVNTIAEGGSSAPITVVLNWTEELKARVPTK